MRRAFTLIELLVVVSIIALLIAFLLPALSSARDSARLVACASNQRQIGIANTLYTDENKGQFPSYLNAINTYAVWGGKDGTEYRGERLINDYVGASNTVTTDDDEGVFQVFRCPNDVGMRASRWPADRLPTIFDTFGSSYLYNSGANNNDGVLGLFEKTIDDIRRPSEVIVAHDMPFYAYGFVSISSAAAASGVPFQTGYWHNKSQVGWANVVFVDGHVSFLQATYDAPDFQNGNGWTFVYNN